jgi:hypothetical protein
MGSILHTEPDLEKAIQRLENARHLACRNADNVFPPSLVVKGEAQQRRLLSPSRTVARYANGMSGHEIDRISKAAHFMRKFGTPVFITTEDHDADERSGRRLFSQVKNHTVKKQRDFQRELGRPFPAYWAEVLESEYAVHQHLISVVPVGRFARRLIASLEASRLFGQNIKAKPAYDVNELVRYLCKEATTQAHYAKGFSFHRNPGAHRLGKGGGDRVRLSRSLEADLILGGEIERYRKTYVSRALPPTPKPVITLCSEPDPHGLFGPLPEVVAPSRDHVLPPRQRFKLVLPEQAELALERLPDAIDLMARLGSTHAEIAVKIGRSRAQTTNILNRQFGASRPVTRRVLELALAA